MKSYELVLKGVQPCINSLGGGGGGEIDSVSGKHRLEFTINLIHNEVHIIQHSSFFKACEKEAYFTSKLNQ